MPAPSIMIDRAELDQLRNALKTVGGTMARELKIVTNKTANKTKLVMSREIRKELRAPAAKVKKTLRVSIKATTANTSAEVQLKKGERISLKEFNARQTRKGVTHKISKRRGRGRVDDAFMGPRPGAIATKLHGHVFKRRGEARLPIQKLYGPSPWGVFAINRMRKPTVQEITPEYVKQLQHRIRFKVLKAQGLI